MKAFEFFNDFGCTAFPDDCKYIWEYLEDKGKINISKRELNDYYGNFSEIHCAGWLDPKAENNYWLEKFAEWMSDQEL